MLRARADDRCADSAPPGDPSYTARKALVQPLASEAEQQESGTAHRAYRPRVAEHTVLHPVIRNHLDGFLHEAAPRCAHGAPTIPDSHTEFRTRQHVKVPVGVGFGIRDAVTARAVADHSDAVVIGSKLVELLEVQPRDNVAQTGGAFIREIRAALDA